MAISEKVDLIVTRKLRSAVVGTGGISLQHLAHISASSRTTLVGVCDLSAAAARFTAERFDAESWTANLDELAPSHITFVKGVIAEQVPVELGAVGTHRR